ncbi:hypothetical protein B0H19DRAFT_1256628 [Mycena capillaripes]|nr:hypothetical protein B0H19DRAFT_1256628 [Mycena capillaripes]
MEQWFVSRKAFLKGLLTFGLLLSSATGIPILSRFYSNVGPAAAFIVWVSEQTTTGFGVFSLFITLDMVHLLARDAYEFACLRRSGSPTPRRIGVVRLLLMFRSGSGSPTSGPTALQDGTPTRASANLTAIDIIAPFTYDKPSKLFCILSYGYCFVEDCSMKKVVSLQRPLLANVSSMLLYILRGSSVLGAALLIALLVVRFKRRSQSAAQPVVFEKDVTNVKEKLRVV